MSAQGNALGTKTGAIEALKGRNKGCVPCCALSGLDICVIRLATQGVALGWFVAAFQAENRKGG